MALPEGSPGKSGHKADWAAYAIDHGVPSYEAWTSTVDELVTRFDQPDPVAPPVDGRPEDIGPAHYPPAAPADPEPEAPPRAEDLGAGHAKRKTKEA